MALPRLPDPDEEVLHVHTAAGQHGPLSRRALTTKLAAGELSEAGTTRLVNHLRSRTDKLREKLTPYKKPER
jgi:hypothetical protein